MSVPADEPIQFEDAVDATIIAEDGTPREVRINDDYFTVTLGDERMSPAVTTNIEKELNADTEPVQDQCGHTQRTRVGDSGWLVRIQCHVTKNDRTGSLGLDGIDRLAASSNVKITTEIFTGTIEVSNVVVTQSSDVVDIKTPEMDEPESAYSVQLQFGEKNSNN